MSNSYVIACKDCKHTLDIGTSHGIYYAEESVMEEFSSFLLAHVSHHLSFEDGQAFEQDGLVSEASEDNEEYRPDVYRYKSYTNPTP